MNLDWIKLGLCFECIGCGNCCAGPNEGYIWLTEKEIHLLADYLKRPFCEVRKQYIRRVGLKLSIKEQPITKDCIFLCPSGTDKRGCAIYPVRPLQCRTWPFWKENLRSPDHWLMASERCPGINRGRLYTKSEILHILQQTQWW